MTKQQTIELLQQQLPAFYSVEQVINIINGIEDDFQVQAYNENQIREMADQIADEIASGGIDLVNDFDLSLDYKEISLDDISLNRSDISSLIEDGIKSWIKETK